MTAPPPFMTTENVSERLGFAPRWRVTGSSRVLMAAIWQFEDNSTYELRGPAVDNTNLTAMPVSGHHHHTYFGNGRRKWS